jgi:hypothetical protein
MQINKHDIEIPSKHSLSGYYTLLVGMWLSVAIMEISVEIPQKVKVELPYDPMSLWGIYLKECKLAYNSNTCTLMFSSTIYNT